jgi:AcrR family transcriptional regulator
MKAISQKKMLQRRRKMSHFIDAADQIISEKGIEGLTIRGVSEIAGYNSATLYGYFTNLDHLIYYTYMKHVSELDQLLRPAFDLSGNPTEALEVVWRLFCKYAYEQPSVVYTLMLSPYAVDFKEILADYAEIDRISSGKDEADCHRSLFTNSIFDAVSSKLQAFEESLNLDSDAADELSGFIQTYFQGQLVRTMTLDSEISLENYLGRMVRFIDQIIWSYTVKREHKGVI